MGLVYIAAFASWATQVTGLIGEHGIVPCSPFLNFAVHHSGAERFLALPTLFWLDSSDFALQCLPWLGVFLSLVFLFGVMEGPLLLALWIFYLSIVNVGADFMSFQWDLLLLETGFLAVFLAPWKLFSKVPFITPSDQNSTREPPLLIIWLLRFLCFRLMFMSGCVKIMSSDATWRNFTALHYHYETQPLPTPIAWYLNQLPDWFQSLSTAGTFIFELIVPLFIFLPRPFRLIAAYLLILLQVLIALSGNYAFFNLLTIALCILLLDDRAITKLLPASLKTKIQIENEATKPMPKTTKAGLIVACLFFALGISELAERFTGRYLLPLPTRMIQVLNQGFHLTNSYGLFAVMTTTRPEIIVEGSNDGKNWAAYEFKSKPGDLHRAPPWVAPHQPRLDWQMWFAALNPGEVTPWFRSFIKCLLDGRPEVIALMERDPFSGCPPKQIRALIYDYHFTTFAEMTKSGNWWKRRYIGIYLPPVSRLDLE